MQTYIKRNDGNTCLMIIFGGWLTDENSFLPYFDGSFDIIMINHYSSDLPLVIPGGNKYKRVILIAWSFGVWAAEYFLPKMYLKPKLSIAVNGTPYPIDDKYGISVDKVDSFLNKIDTNRYRELNEKTFGPGWVLQHKRDKKHDKPSKETISEFRWLYNRIMEQNKPTLKWDYAITSSNNGIYPEDNLDNYWNNIKRCKKIRIDYPMFPFGNWKTLMEFVEFVESHKQR